MILSPSKDQKYKFTGFIRIMPGWVYILRLQSGFLYVGATTDLANRYEDHCSSKACRTTALDPPIALIYSEKCETFQEARQREAQVKGWTRAKKEALVVGDLAKLKESAKSRQK